MLFKRLAEALPTLLSRRPAPTTIPKPRQVQRRLTAKQVDQLVREYESGDDMKILAALRDVHRATVAAQLRRAGVSLRRQGVPPDQFDEVVRLYREGCSCQRLAERYNCDDESVRRTLKRTDLVLRAPWECP